MSIFWGIIWVYHLNLAVFAADAGSIVTEKFEILQDIILSVVTAIGVIIALWGIFELGNAMQKHDGSAMSSAFKRIGGGLIMIVAPKLLPLLT